MRVIQVSGLSQPIDRRAMLATLVLFLGGCTTRGAGDATDSLDALSSEVGTVAPPGGGAAHASDALLDAIERRRSVRSFTDVPVSDEDIALMLWAAQGVTEPSRGFRAAPSAGALYPLELYAATGEGLLRYDPDLDEIERLGGRDVRGALAAASLAQTFVGRAPVVFIITGVYGRTSGKYGDRAERYVHLEAGHAAQNLLLVATHLGLGGTTVGAFVDEIVRLTLGAESDETPLYVIPIGVPA